jgi:RNA polymerase sigma-70 factor (ECF subfamily)
MHRTSRIVCTTNVGAEKFPGKIFCAVPVDLRMDLERDALACLKELYAFALRLSRSREAAEDLVQEAFARVLAHSGPPPLEIRPYLFRTLRNLFVDSLRSRKNLDPMQVPSELPEVPTPEQVLLESMLSEWLESALMSLELPLREALWLREVDGFTYAEIAEITDSPVNTVRSRLSRARTQLKDLIAAGPKVPEGCPLD